MHIFSLNNPHDYIMSSSLSMIITVAVGILAMIMKIITSNVLSNPKYSDEFKRKMKTAFLVVALISLFIIFALWFYRIQTRTF